MLSQLLMLCFAMPSCFYWYCYLYPDHSFTVRSLLWTGRDTYEIQVRYYVCVNIIMATWCEFYQKNASELYTKSPFFISFLISDWNHQCLGVCIICHEFFNSIFPCKSSNCVEIEHSYYIYMMYGHTFAKHAYLIFKTLLSLILFHVV